MGVGVGKTIEAFTLLYKSLWRREFRKSLKINEYSERELLPLVRTFLLGYFGESLVPEASSVLPGSLSGIGRIDFLIGDVAVEFVVRRPYKPKTVLLPKDNTTEVKKLLKYHGHALLVLFDLSANPLASADLDAFRILPSLGRGSHRKSAFNLAYYYLAVTRPLETGLIRKNIRVE